MKLMLKIILTILILSLSLNFILIDSIGNVYFSTVILFLSFFVILFLTNASLLKKKGVIIAFFILFFIVISCFFSILLDLSNFNPQIVALVIYIQNILAFSIFYFVIDYKNKDFFYRCFLISIFIASLRLIIEEYHNLFLFSTKWGERLEGSFIGAINNYALLCGLSFFITIFIVKNKILRFFLSVFWILMITVTLSRGAFLGVLITVFAVAVYDVNKRVFKSLIKVSFFLTFSFAFFLIFFNKIGIILDKINDRFLSFFSGEKKLSSFSSGRTYVWEDLLSRFFNSNIFEILFGHGPGSINFVVKEIHYHSSHNIFLDVLYKNGIFVFVLYLFIVCRIFNLFIKDRSREKLLLFSFFFFLHFEILFNPFPFAAQSGWIYFAFLAILIKQNKIISNE